MTIWYNIIKRFAAPSLPKPTETYDQRYFDALVNVLRLYFNQLDDLLGRIVAVTASTVPVSIGGVNVDAFGRIRSSAPYTLFDSQNRYAKNDLFSESTSGTAGATIGYLPNESTVTLTVAASTDVVIRQTYRSFSYQPGKGLLVMNTFVMPPAVSGLTIRIGYFNDDNGVYLERDGTTVSFVRRSYTGGSVSNTPVTQANWNGDKLDGTGASGYTLDLTKAQIFWEDFEWLGVGSVRCGFVINGETIICHTFQNANNLNTVYMTTAILPVRYEIRSTGGAGTLKQICSTVISEGGYEKKVAPTVVRAPISPTAAKTATVNTLTPLVAIRLASGRTGAVVIPDGFSVLCTTTPADYEIILLKGTVATLYSAGPGAWSPSGSANVEFATTGTLVDPPNPVSNIVYQQFASGSNQVGGASGTTGDYNWDLQLGASLSNVSDVYVLAVRPISGNEDFYASLSFWDLT